MRTLKQNIVELEPGEKITIRCGNTSVDVAAVDSGERNTMEIAIPHGVTAANIRQARHAGWDEVMFAKEDGLLQELHGAIDFIVFALDAEQVEHLQAKVKETLETIDVGWSPEQAQYLADHGIKVKKDEDLNATPEASSLTHPNLATVHLEAPSETKHLTKRDLIAQLEQFNDDAEVVVTLPLVGGDSLTHFIDTEVGTGWKPSNIIELKLGEFATG